MKKSVLFFLVLSSLAAAPDFSKPQTFLGFADALADEGDYYRAISEYKKVLYYFPEYEKKDWINFQIGRMYFLGGRYDQAKDYLVPLTARPKDELNFYTLNFLALSYFENREYLNSARLFGDLSREKQDSVRRWDYIIYESMSLAHLKKYTEARKILHKARAETDKDSASTYADFYRKSDAVLADAEALSEKSPGWAIAFGILFPGGGHLYLKQWDNAFVSFILVLSTGLLAWDGFERDSPVQAGIFTTLASGFYIGSVYSGYRQAKKYNLTLGQEEQTAYTREFKLLNLKISQQLRFGK